jgi:hypothetical protein
MHACTCCVCLRFYFALPQGAAGGIDSVGGETLNQIVQSLKPDGTVLVYGAMSGFTAQVDLISLLFNTITVKVCTPAHVAFPHNSLQYRSAVYHCKFLCTAVAIAGDSASTTRTAVLQRSATMLSESVMYYCYCLLLLPSTGLLAHTIHQAHERRAEGQGDRHCDEPD